MEGGERERTPTPRLAAMASASSSRAAASRLLRPLAAAGMLLLEHSPAASAGAARRFATTPTYCLRGKVLQCSDIPAKSPILLNGRDFRHWLVVMDPPTGDARNPSVHHVKIINHYITTLAKVVGR